MNPSSSRRLQPLSVRVVFAGLVLFGLFAGFLNFLTKIRPLDTWFFVQLARIWAYDAYLTLACASFGLRFVSYCGLRNHAFLERLAYALPCGLIAFVVGMYVGGFLGWYGALFALALPACLLLVGCLGSRSPGEAPLFDHALWPAPSIASLAAAGFGVGCIGLLYLGILTPDAVNYDASWNHLVIAQDYARAGRITPLIGDWVKNVPHLGSIVNTWAFLVPGLDEAPLRWMQALHNEFTTFLWSLVGVAAGVRLLADRPKVRGGWAAIFLFPSLFVYDGNMGAAADHYLALFSVPVMLAGLRLLDAITWRRALLLGWLAGGALLTKLHAVYVLIPLCALIAVHVAGLFLQRLRNPNDTRFVPALLALGVGALTASALLALHFGKNAYFYRNPFYPMAQGTFRSVPTLPDAQLQMDYLFADWHWHSPSILSERVKQAAKMMFSFSFKPHYTFIGDIPMFGSLFTLLLPMVFFLKRARRLALAVMITLGAVFMWAMTFWVDRSLQTFMPALAVVTGALAVRTWELGPLVRVPLAALIGLQIVWGGDYYFSGSDRMASSIALIRSGIEGHAQDRFASYRREYRDLGNSLPANALVMLHNNHIMLGIDRPVLLDWAGYQGVIDYRQFKSPRDLHDRLVQLGVTHVVYIPGARSAPTKQEEVIFDAYAALNARATKNFGSLRVFPVAIPPAKLERPLNVFCWQLRDYGSGLYAIEALSSNDEMPPQLQGHPGPRLRLTAEADAAKLLEQADAALVSNEASVPSSIRALVAAGFVSVRSHSSVVVYVRKTSSLAIAKSGK